MGLTESHWFEYEEQPKLTEQQLENAIMEIESAYKRGYEKGFNDAMLGKQELMYEGTDGKWYKKYWW